MQNRREYSFRVPFPYWIFSVPTAIIGMSIHGSIWWAIFDFLFYPFVWLKWLLFKEVNLSIIKSAFEFFLQ